MVSVRVAAAASRPPDRVVLFGGGSYRPGIPERKSEPKHCLYRLEKYLEK